jgi:hypothetical protein
MSNPQTFYTYGDQDLSAIFQPLSLGSAYPNATGFKIPGGRDFNQIFAAGNNLGYNVGYKYNGQDLSQIFAKYNPLPFNISGSAPNYTSNYSNGYYYIEFNAGNNGTTITFEPNIPYINVVLIGAGGNGGTGGTTNHTYNLWATGGGGGGTCMLNAFSSSTGITHTIQYVGNGNGQNTQILINSNTFTANGGSIGLNASYNSTQPAYGISGGKGGAASPSNIQIYTDVLSYFIGNGGNGGNGGQYASTTPNSSNNLWYAKSGDNSDYYLCQNIINSPFNSDILNGGGGGGAASSTPTPGSGGGGNGGSNTNDGNGKGGTPSNTSPLIVAGIAGGGGANYSGSSNIGGAGKICYYFAYPPINNTYISSGNFYTGVYNTIYDGSYCYINFYTSGTLTLLSHINNATIICVGGGGGGGGKMENGTSDVNGAGGGGGGGGAGVVTGITLSNLTYNIGVGSGGIGGAQPGNTGFAGEIISGTDASHSYFDTIITANGGTGGHVIRSGGSTSSAAGGSVTSSVSLFCGGNGGNGGAGLYDVNYYAYAGANSEIYNFTGQGSHGFQLPNGKFVYFSGGGGGGKDGSSSYGTGGYPGIGQGGGQGTIGYYNSVAWTEEVSWPNTNVSNPPHPLFSIDDCNGKNGVLYGSGGGGCGGDLGALGGNGANGIVMLIFKYK